jgi:elongation factor G
MGTIIGDINSRRGRIEGMEHAAGSQVIKAMVPLAEILRSSPYGRPRYKTRFAGYGIAPTRDGEDGTFIFAKKPDGPRPRKGFAAEPESWG